MKFEVKNGSFSYMDEKKKNVLRDISYEVGEGEILGILGRNGAGKTTLLRCSMGMLPWKEGAAFLNGENIKSVKKNLLWQKLAYVPQAKGTGAFPFQVEEMVLLGRNAYLKPWRQPGKKDKEMARRAMEQVGIEKLYGRSCAKLSGGELQMVLIARALAGEPRLLILDEPESNLDFKNQLLILNTLKRLAHQEKISCIFNTHYPSHALQYADKALLLMNDGASMFGEADRIITKENLEKIFEVEVYIHEIEQNGIIFKEILPIEILENK